MKVLLAVALLLGLAGVGWWMLSQGREPAELSQEQQQIVNSISSSAGETNNQNNQQIMQTETITRATLHTTKGDIILEFFAKDAPQTVANFVKLAEQGFYNGTKFHRVIAGFMIQGGDPLTRDDSQQARWGTGGPGYTFADEIHAGNRNAAGTISMANAGPNTNGSQFFINATDNSFLDTKHTVFGRVVVGEQVVAAIERTQTDASDRPLEPVVLERITLQ